MIGRQWTHLWTSWTRVEKLKWKIFNRTFSVGSFWGHTILISLNPMFFFFKYIACIEFFGGRKRWRRKNLTLVILHVYKMCKFGNNPIKCFIAYLITWCLVAAILSTSPIIPSKRQIWRQVIFMSSIWIWIHYDQALSGSFAGHPIS